VVIAPALSAMLHSWVFAERVIYPRGLTRREFFKPFDFTPVDFTLFIIQAAFLFLYQLQAQNRGKSSSGPRQFLAQINFPNSLGSVALIRPLSLNIRC
jgi:hypothetical protein